MTRIPKVHTRLRVKESITSVRAFSPQGDGTEDNASEDTGRKACHAWEHLTGSHLPRSPRTKEAQD